MLVREAGSAVWRPTQLAVGTSAANDAGVVKRGVTRPVERR